MVPAEEIRAQLAANKQREKALHAEAVELLKARKALEWCLAEALFGLTPGRIVRVTQGRRTGEIFAVDTIRAWWTCDLRPSLAGRPVLHGGRISRQVGRYIGTDWEVVA